MDNIISAPATCAVCVYIGYAVCTQILKEVICIPCRTGIPTMRMSGIEYDPEVPL